MDLCIGLGIIDACMCLPIAACNFNIIGLLIDFVVDIIVVVDILFQNC